MEIEVRSCRLNGIIKGNAKHIPIFSSLDESVRAKEGALYDYQWVDVGNIRYPWINGDTSSLDSRLLHTEVLLT